MPFWNCYPASAHVPAYSPAAPVSPMDYHVPTCASYRHAATRRKKLSFSMTLVTQMMMQMMLTIDMFCYPFIL